MTPVTLGAALGLERKRPGSIRPVMALPAVLFPYRRMNDSAQQKATVRPVGGMAFQAPASHRISAVAFQKLCIAEWMAAGA